VTSPFRGPIWRNTQCEAVRRRMIFGPRCHAPNNHRPARCVCQNSESPTSTPGMSDLAKSRSASDAISPKLVAVVSGKPRGPRRIVTLSPLGYTKIGATRRGSALCCPRLGYIASECRRLAPESAVLCLEGRKIVIELRRRTLAMKVHGGASYKTV